MTSSTKSGALGELPSPECRALALAYLNKQRPLVPALVVSSGVPGIDISSRNLAAVPPPCVGVAVGNNAGRDALFQLLDHKLDFVPLFHDRFPFP